MFETELKEKFQKIFELKKVTFDAPGESNEQDCLFIEVEHSKNVIKDGVVKAMVSGNCLMYSQNEKLPFGFFSKAIKQADQSLTKDLFFYEIESNNQRYRNLIKRGFSFVYFFSSQYDPKIGSITSVETNVEEL